MEVGEKIYSENSKEQYTILQTLKSGGQAEVAFAIAEKDKKVFFIKRLLSIKYTEKTKKQCTAFESVQNKLYRQLSKESTEFSSCPKVIDFFREKTFYYVVTERIVGVQCDTKELFFSLSIQQRLDLFKIIVYSFYGLEKNNVVHGDVKPENLLLKKVNKHFVSKLIDLESAFFSSNPPERGCIVGTDPYSSPELIDYNDEDSDIKYELSPKSDIFSLGVILYELVCGEYPISTLENAYAFEISKKGEELIFNSDCSKELQNLIISMLDLDPQKRPGVMAILKCLKELSDISTIPNYYCSRPQLIIERKSEEVAYLHFFSFLYDAVIKVSIDGAKEEIFATPILIEDDDIPVSAHIEVKSNDGCTLISDTLNEIVSVASERNERVDRPNIDISDGRVSISTFTSDAKIYYTTDGSLPTRKSTLYEAPISLPEHIVVKAIAIKRGMLSSDIASRNTSSSLRMS